MNFIITILGSGAALPTGSRHCSAQVLSIHGQRILLDCAEGTQDRIRHQHLKLQSIGIVLISHLHGDHFFGLPGLLSTMHLCGRTEPMDIVAPAGARKVLETTFELTGNHVDFPIVWHEMDFAEGEQRVLEGRRCTVDAFPLQHSVPCYGFRIADRGTPQITYAYCCDTAYNESLVPHLRDVDVLCLESTFGNEREDLARERCHLTAGQAGRLAALAGAKTLLLTHISARYKEPTELLQQAQAEFENSIVVADGMRIEADAKPAPRPMQKSE